MMKKIVILVLSCLCLNTLIVAQDTDTVLDKNWKLGIHFDFNYSNILYKVGTQPLGYDGFRLLNKAGFALGINAEYKVTNSFFLVPKMEIGFNGGNIQWTTPNEAVTEYELIPLSINFMFYAHYKRQLEKLNPYFFAGTGFRMSLDREEEDLLREQYSHKSDVSIDFGLGFDRLFSSKFVFAPELKYSAGVLNLNDTDVNGIFRRHSIAIIFNFKA